MIIDQFEELFALPRPEITVFEQALGELLRSPKCQLLLAVRADFYRDLMTLSLWRHIQAHRLELLPLDEDGMRQAIVNPAEQEHVFVEGALVERLVRDAAHEPGGMALIQETLILLWDRLQRRLLTLFAYERLGRAPKTGLQVAIAWRADDAVGELTEQQRRIARRIFLRLVQFGQGRPDSGRRQPVQSLKSVDDEGDNFNTTLESLVRARLLTLGARDSSGDSHAELAHETLIHCWPTLQEWLIDHREAEQIRRRFEEKAMEWVRLGRGTGGLLDEVEHLEVSRWMETADAQDLGCSDDLLQLVSSSRTVFDEAKEREELSRQRELAQAKALAAEQQQRAEAEQKQREEQTRRARTLRWSLVIVAVMLGLALGAAWLAWQKKIEADHSRWRSIVQALVAQSSHFEIHREDERAALLARQAYLFHRRAQLHELGPVDSAIRGVLQMPAFASILKAHALPTMAVTWGSDGATLTSVGQDGTAAQWRTIGATTRQIKLSDYDQEMRESDVAFFHMVLSPSGHRVAVAAPFAKAVKVWDLRQPLAAPISVNMGSVHADALALSKDEKYLAAGSNTGMILIWRLDSPGAEPRRLNAHSYSVTALAFSPDGKNLVSSSHDGTAKLWDLTTGTLARRLLEDHDSALMSLEYVFSSDGRMVAMGSGNGTVRLWDLSRPADQGPIVFGPYDWGIAAVEFSSDRSHLAAADLEGTVRLWDLANTKGAPILLQSHKRRIFCLSFHPGGKLLAAGNVEGDVYVWRIGAGLVSKIAKIEGTDRNETRIAFSADGKRLISVSTDGHLRFWSRNLEEEADLSHPMRTEFFTVHGSLLSVAVNPAKPLLATGGGSEMTSGDVTVWDLRNNKPSAISTAPEGNVFSVAFSPDGKRLAAGEEKGIVWVWDLRRPVAEPTELHPDEGIVWAVRFSPNGKLLVAAGDTGKVRAWNVANFAAAPNVIASQVAPIFALAFSPDGRTLASGSRDLGIRLWPLDHPGAMPRLLIGHEGYVQALAFDPSGHSLASASSDETVRVWDLSNPGDVITLRGHTNAVFSVAFSPDGAELVSGGEDGTIRIWNPRTDALADSICTQVWRNLSLAEWRQFVGQDIPYERTCANLPPANPNEERTPLRRIHQLQP